MAREIDWKKLSDEDREYVKQRPWMIREAEMAGVKNAKEMVFDDSESADTDDDELDDERPTDYTKWRKAQLQEEIDRRNESLDDDEQIDRDGTVAELAERLKEDDELDEE